MFGFATCRRRVDTLYIINLKLNALRFAVVYGIFHTNPMPFRSIPFRSAPQFAEFCILVAKIYVTLGDFLLEDKHQVV